MTRTFEAARQLLESLIAAFGPWVTLALGAVVLATVVAWYWWQERRARRALDGLREVIREKDLRISDKQTQIEELRLQLSRSDASLQVYQRALSASGGRLLDRDTNRLIQIEEDFRSAQKRLASGAGGR